MSANAKPRENLRKNLQLYMKKKTDKRVPNTIKFFNSRDREKALFTDEGRGADLHASLLSRTKATTNESGTRPGSIKYGE